MNKFLVVFIKLLLLAYIPTTLASDWEDLAVPVKLENGKVWQLMALSDDFNYTAPPEYKSTEFKNRWVEGYINDWSGPGWTEWDSAQSEVKNGKLQLSAQRKPGSWAINMGSITSKESLQYPLFLEIRAKISNSVLASNFWMLSEDSTQEIDVLEAYGGERKENEWFAQRLHLSHHVFIREPFQDYQPTSDDTWFYNGTMWRDDYHRIGVYWRDPWHLEYYVDGKLVKISSGKDIIDPKDFTNGTGLNKPMRVIINLEDQTWRTEQGLTPTDAELAEKEKVTYNIDWVRFYKPVDAN